MASLEARLLQACREGDFNLALQLIQQGCNPRSVEEKRDDDESDDGFLAIRVLVGGKQWGYTPLHYACEKGDLGFVKSLVETYSCDPQWKDGSGETPLHVACGWGRLDIVKYLITEGKCNPRRTDIDGQTPLHKACRKGKKDVVRYLLREVHCDPNHATKRTLWNFGDYEPTPPLGVTRDPSIIRELIECGANPEKIIGELPENCPKQPTELAVKVFVVGEKGAGKSTLTKAMSLQKGVWANLVNRFLKVTGVDANTAGIIPHDIQSERFGHIILYDFAGHKEFYASHSAMLRNAAVGSTAAIILLVVDLRESDERIIRSIQSWLHLISTACHMHISSGSKSHVIVVGSRADEPKSKENIPRKRNNVTALFPMSDVNFVGFVATDCRYAASSSMSELHEHLSESCYTVRNQAKASSSCHFFFLYLLQTYQGSPGVSVRTIVADFQKPQSKKLTQYVPEIRDLPQVQKLCEEMSEKGNVLLLRNEATFEESWVVFNQDVLLSQVTGTVFAPKDSGFREYREIANTTGVVPFSKLEGIFPKLDPNMLVQFLCHLEFCHEITDPEGLRLLQAASGSATPNERWFFFPSLVKINASGHVWKTDGMSVYQSGWLLECSLSHQFFTPHFLQVLLLRLAFSFALAPDISHDHPALQRKCSVWKNGIYWSNHNGVECLVEIEERQTLVMLRCPKGTVHELGCWHLRSLVVRKVLDALESNISTSETVLHPSDVTYPLNQDVGQFSIQAIAEAIPKTKPSAVSTNGRTAMLLEELLHFEPYAQLSQHILQELFCEHNQGTITDEFLRHFANRVNDSNYVDLFEHLIAKIYDHNDQEPSDLLQLMQVWRDRSEGTYQCLRRELDQFSVFAGRNPLELTGYASKGTTASGDSASINSDETTPSPEWPLEKIDDSTLDIRVLHDVSIAVVTVVVKKRELLGLALRLSRHTLDRIAADYPGDSCRNLTEILAAWLQKEDDCTPSWRALVAALRKPTVGKEALADVIAKAHGAGDSQNDSSDISVSYKNVDNRPLDSLYQVIEEVWTIHDWFHLGLALKLSYHTLKMIEANHRQGTVHQCLTKMLQAWLDKQDSTAPSWQALVCALSSPIVNKREVANTIAASHQKSNC